jgi:hypothetical protein
MDGMGHLSADISTDAADTVNTDAFNLRRMGVHRWVFPFFMIGGGYFVCFRGWICPLPFQNLRVGGSDPDPQAV